MGFTALDLETFSDQPNQAVLEYLRDTSQTRLYNVAGETTDVFLEAASRYRKVIKTNPYLIIEMKI